MLHALQSCWLFAPLQLSDDDVGILRRLVDKQGVPALTRFRDGYWSEQVLYIVAYGSVLVTSSLEGATQLPTVVEAGGLFGERGLVLGEAESMRCEAVEHSVVWTLSFDSATQWLERLPRR